MKKFILASIAGLSIAMGFATPAEAKNRREEALERARDNDSDSDSTPKDRPARPNKPHGVPELDKSVAASAAVLIGGGLMVVLGRKRRQSVDGF